MVSVLCKGPVQGSNLFKNLTRESEQAKKEEIILIVEDQTENGAALKLLLHPFLYKTVVMPTAVAGLSFLAEHSEEVILILSDINLPGMSGLEFVEKVRGNSKFKQIPIIIQSSEDEEDLKKGVALGANGYVRKPYEKEALYAEIAKLIKLDTKEGKRYERTSEHIGF